MPRSRSSLAVEQALFSLAADRLERVEEVDALADEFERNAQSYKDRETGFWGKESTHPVGWRFLVELAEVTGLLVHNRETEDAWRKLEDAID